MESNSGDILGILILGFLGGLWLIYSGMKTFLFVQKIKNTPTSKVGSAAVGMVELSGKARSRGNLKSPVSGVPCGYWKITAEYWHSSKNSGWRQFYQDHSSCPFFLEDETGRMLVDPAYAKVDIPEDAAFQGYISGRGFWGMKHEKIDARVLKFIRGLCKSDKAAFKVHEHNDVRVTESFIADGDEIYILGTALPREKAAKAVAHENLVLKKGSGVMYISDSAEMDITKTFDTGAMLNIAGGLAVSSLCLFLLLIMLFPYLAPQPLNF
jgi:hypothetical protein